MKKFAKVDIQAKVTSLIVSRLEEGGLPPWKCPWAKSGVSPIPINWDTKKPYSGINVLLLWLGATDAGFSSNSWLTFNQAKKLGGNVRKGEKAINCIFYKPVEVDDKSTEDEEKKRYNCLKSFSLFNVEQVEGVDFSDDQPSSVVEWSAGEASENLINHSMRYCKSEGIGFRSGGNRAYYSPSLDIVKLPESFYDEAGYGSTLAHEISNSTGHPKRLDRFDEFNNEFDKKIDAYAFEELVAEISSVVICSTYNVEIEIDQHVSYLDSWLKAMKADKSFIFKASSHAFKAYSYFMDSSDECVIG